MLNKLDYKPMPIIQPGSGKVTLNILATEPIKGVVQTELKIVRTVNKIKLPVNCYKVEGEFFGSWYNPQKTCSNIIHITIFSFSASTPISVL